MEGNDRKWEVGGSCWSPHYKQSSVYTMQLETGVVYNVISFVFQDAVSDGIMTDGTEWGES